MFAVALLVLVPLGAITIPVDAGANTITVNNTTDPATTSNNGFCTLREAIDNANSPIVDTTGGDCAAGNGDDRIMFSVSGIITLGSTLPAVLNKLTIDGTGQTITVDGADLSNILTVATGATLNINALTIAHANDGRGEGGAIFSDGTLNISNSTFSDNSVSSGGGAIFSDHNGILTVTNSTFSGNSADFGGGIFNNGTATITNTTFSGNSVTSDGGGFYNNARGIINNSTLSGNGASRHGGGIFSDGTLAVTNSIISNSSGGGDCSGVITGSYNISDDNSCGFGTSTGANGQTIGDNINPLLDPNGLQNNGGPTQTIALLSTSPAIDAIPLAQCPTTDQRGFARPDPEDSTSANAACDVGAFEFTELKNCNTISISGSMEGKLAIAAGNTVQGGYDFTMPTNHPDAHVTFTNGSVTVQVTCPDNSVHPLTISLPMQTYDDPLNSSAWFPSSDSDSPLVYQGSTISNVCGTQTGYATQGATFTAQVCSDDAVDKVNVRFHYRDNSKGAWSGKQSVTP